MQKFIKKYMIGQCTFSIATIVLTISQVGCKKFIEVDHPSTSISGSNVFSTDATAIAVMTGIYISLSTNNLNFATGANSISIFSGLSSDELKLHSTISNATRISYYRNNLTPSVAGVEFWNNIYPYIYKVNSAIEGLTSSTSLTPTVKKQLIGEAKFMRGLCYFYLTNFYGDVPLVLTTNYKETPLLPRAPKTMVFQQIIGDLKEAQELLSSNFVDASLLKNTTERVRPTKWAATALLARAYLYNGSLTGEISNYQNAETQSNSIINNTALFKLTSLDSVFLKNSFEAVWQLQPVNTGQNTADAWYMILPTTGPSNTYPVYLNSTLLNSFESNDNRKNRWTKNVTVGSTTYSYAYKYKSATLNAPLTEYLMVLRLAEQFLIRAEAKAQQNRISESLADLNLIRKRANLQDTITADKILLLKLILHERQIELFTEWGHRWLDLKRTGNIDAVMSIVTPLKANNAPWRPFQSLFPIPPGDIQKDPNLTQNSGY